MKQYTQQELEVLKQQAQDLATNLASGQSTEAITIKLGDSLLTNHIINEQNDELREQNKRADEMNLSLVEFMMYVQSIGQFLPPEIVEQIDIKYNDFKEKYNIK
jgi:hypothetical protein